MGIISYEKGQLNTARRYFTMGAYADEIDCVLKLDAYFLKEDYEAAMESGDLDTAWSLIQERECHFTKVSEKVEYLHEAKVEGSLHEIKKLKKELATSPGTLPNLTSLMKDALSQSDTAFNGRFFTPAPLQKTLKELHHIHKKYAKEHPKEETLETLQHMLDLSNDILSEPVYLDHFPQLEQLKPFNRHCQHAILVIKEIENTSLENSNSSRMVCE